MLSLTPLRLVSFHCWLSVGGGGGGGGYVYSVVGQRGPAILWRRNIHSSIDLFEANVIRYVTTKRFVESLTNINDSEQLN